MTTTTIGTPRIYHVTRRSSVGADCYGHDTSRCDPAGCSGDEMYLGAAADDINPGDLVIEAEGGGLVLSPYEEE